MRVGTRVNAAIHANMAACASALMMDRSASVAMETMKGRSANEVSGVVFFFCVDSYRNYLKDDYMLAINMEKIYYRHLILKKEIYY